LFWNNDKKYPSPEYSNQMNELKRVISNVDRINNIIDQLQNLVKRSNTNEKKKLTLII
jgi:hypothetical protein